MKIKTNKKTLQILAVLMGFLAVGTPIVYAASDSYYASTAFYFNVPSDATFSIGMPDTWSLNAITGTSEGGATATSWASFNFTSVPEQWVEPQVTGDATKKQNGVEEPLFYIDNTGNVNEQFDVRFSVALPSGIVVCANATCSQGGSCGTVTSACTNIDTSYVTMATSVDTSSYLNITFYANVTAAASGGQGTATLYTRSTAV